MRSITDPKMMKPKMLIPTCFLAESAVAENHRALSNRHGYGDSSGAGRIRVQKITCSGSFVQELVSPLATRLPTRGTVNELASTCVTLYLCSPESLFAYKSCPMLLILMPIRSGRRNRRCRESQEVICLDRLDVPRRHRNRKNQASS